MGQRSQFNDPVHDDKWGKIAIEGGFKDTKFCTFLTRLQKLCMQFQIRISAEQKLFAKLHTVLSPNK